MESNSNRNSRENMEEDVETLKRRISCHPLYGLLVETHLDCLKVGLGNIGDIDRSQIIDQKQADNRLNLSRLSQSELDNFMEEYCTALSNLKAAMKEPQQETMAFIDNMHSQLKELTRTHPAPAPPATTSLGKKTYIRLVTRCED